jgi:hypothetical protein
VVTQTKLDNPLTDTISSCLFSKAVFRPYQFRPVLPGARRTLPPVPRRRQSGGGSLSSERDIPVMGRHVTHACQPVEGYRWAR